MLAKGELATTVDVLRHVWTHPANRGARSRAVARALTYQLRGRVLHKPTLARLGESGQLMVNLHSHGASSVLYANPPDWHEMQLWRRLLRPGDLFLDIGSNVGSYAVWAGDCGARVWAFEPDRESVARLRQNVALNQFLIEIFPFALGAEAGLMAFSVGGDTTNHLLAGEDTARGQRVEVRRLDDVLTQGHARGAKIDVEGAERLVLEGSKDALTEHRIDVLQIEWNRMSELTLGEDRVAVARLLGSHGYRLYRAGAGPLEESSEIPFGRDVFAVSPHYLETFEAAFTSVR